MRKGKKREDGKLVPTSVPIMKARYESAACWHQGFSWRMAGEGLRRAMTRYAGSPLAAPDLDCVERTRVQHVRSTPSRIVFCFMQLRCSPYNRIMGPIGPRHAVRNGPRTRVLPVTSPAARWTCQCTAARREHTYCRSECLGLRGNHEPRQKTKQNPARRVVPLIAPRRRGLFRSTVQGSDAGGPGGQKREGPETSLRHVVSAPGKADADDPPSIVIKNKGKGQLVSNPSRRVADCACAGRSSTSPGDDSDASLPPGARLELSVSSVRAA
jgi:hypothetical protein